MLRDEVKGILEEQFDREKNYREIKYKYNKQSNYNKLFQYAIIPITAIILSIIFVPISINKNSDNKKITNVNNISSEKDIIITKDLEDEKGNTIIKEGFSIQNNEIDNKTTQSTKKEIYKTIEPAEACWSYDPTVPDNLINDHIESKYVIKVKIKSVGEGEILPKQENYYNPDNWLTPIKMEIEENLLDSNKLSGELIAYIDGGLIKISNLLKTISYSSTARLGINNLSKEEQEKYIEYKSTGNTYYEPTVGKEYVIIVTKTNENLYQIVCGGYGIFSVEKNNNGKEVYKNVITEKALEI